MPHPGRTGTGRDSICHQCIELASPTHLVWRNPCRAWSWGPRSLRGRRWEGPRPAQGLAVPPPGYFISRCLPQASSGVHPFRAHTCPISAMVLPSSSCVSQNPEVVLSAPSFSLSFFFLTTFVKQDLPFMKPQWLAFVSSSFSRCFVISFLLMSLRSAYL